MRRRKPEPTLDGSGIPAKLLTFDLHRWAPEAPKVLEPRMAWADVRAIREGWRRWRDARTEHAERHGWPGGEEARERGEVDAQPDVRAIFDPTTI